MCDNDRDCQNCLIFIGLTIGITGILYFICCLPIVVIYSDALEATNAKQAQLLVAVLVPLTVIIVAIPAILLVYCCTYDGVQCRWWTVCIIIFIAVIALTIANNVAGPYGKRFSDIPYLCSSHDECQSKCMSINVTLQAHLKDVQELHLSYLNHGDYICGTCSCQCSENSGDECRPVKHPYFGWSVSSKSAASAISVLLNLFVLLLLSGSMYLCFESDYFSRTNRRTALYVEYVVLLTACSLPIVLVYCYDSQPSNVRKNNLNFLVAALVSVFMSIIGFLVATSCRANSHNEVLPRWKSAILLFFILFISVPVMVEFGYRFNSLSDSLDPQSGIHTPTKIALIVLAGMTVVSIIFCAVRNSNFRIQIRRWLHRLWPSHGDNIHNQAGHRNPNRADRNRHRANPVHQPRTPRTVSQQPRNVNDSEDDTYYDAEEPILPTNPNHNSTGHIDWRRSFRIKK